MDPDDHSDFQDRGRIGRRLDGRRITIPLESWGAQGEVEAHLSGRKRLPRPTSGVSWPLAERQPSALSSKKLAWRRPHGASEPVVYLSNFGFDVRNGRFEAIYPLFRLVDPAVYALAVAVRTGVRPFVKQVLQVCKRSSCPLLRSSASVSLFKNSCWPLRQRSCFSAFSCRRSCRP